MHNCLQYGHCSQYLFKPLEHFTQTLFTCIYPNLSPDGGVWLRGFVYYLLWSLRNNQRLKWEKCVSDCNFLSFSFCYKCPLAHTSNRQLNICAWYSRTIKHVSSILDDDFKQYTTWLITELFQFTTLKITLFLFQTGLPSVYIYLRNFNLCLWQTCYTG